MQEKDQKFELLMTKDIVAILDGDKSFGEIEIEDSYEKIKVEMPYLSGPNICGISTLFGFYQNYKGFKSRYDYFCEMFSFAIENEKISSVFNYLFAKSRFEDKLKYLSVETREKTYKEIITQIINEINKILLFSNNELIVIGDNFIIKEKGETIKVIAPQVDKIDRNYISNLSERAMNDIENGSFDSAITKSRTLLEEVFCYVIEKKNETPVDSGKINELYKQVKNLYNMHSDSKIDKRINELLSGLEKIVASISEMRNINSDSHGVGAKRINIADYHARLIVNASMTMSDFILSVYEHNVGLA